nr:MAG TPA: hypothetical protein [Caudoviricetes sp.]
MFYTTHSHQNQSPHTKTRHASSLYHVKALTRYHCITLVC